MEKENFMVVVKIVLEKYMVNQKLDIEAMKEEQLQYQTEDLLKKQ